MSARQAVKLSGLGVTGFEQYIAAVLAIQQVFASHLPADLLERWTPGTEHGYPILEVSNRYFTHRKEAQDEEVDMEPTLDPAGLLRSVMPSFACYTADNKVLYFERKASTQQ